MLTGNRSRLWLYLVLFLGTFIAGMSISSLAPGIMVIAEHLASPADTIQLSFPAFLFSFAFAQLFYGAISDRYGRRTPYILGVSFYLIGSLVCFYASDVSMLILGRFIQGAGIGCTTVLAIAILHDVHDRSLTESFAYLMIVAIIGFLTAPIIVGLFTPSDAWQFVFLGFAVLAGILIVLALLFLPETNIYFHEQHVHRTFFMKNYLKLLSNRGFMGYLLVSCLLFSLPLIVFCTMPVLLVTAFKLTMTSFMWLCFLNIGFYLFGIYLGYLLSEGCGYNTVIWLGIMIMIVAASLGLLLGSLEVVRLVAIYFPTCMILLGAGLAITCALGAYSHRLREYPGTAISIQLFCLTFIASLINFLNAILHENDQIPLMSMFLGTSLATLMVFWLLVPKPASLD